MKHIYSIFLFVFSISYTHAQDLYLVKLKTKENTTSYLTDPIKMLSQRALDRRSRYSVSVDEKDVPISTSRIAQIKNLNLTYVGQTKWLNTVMIETSNAQTISDLKNLSFVESVTSMVRNPIPKRQTQLVNKRREVNSKTSDYSYGFSNPFIQQLNIQPIHQQNILGQNVYIAVIDGGYTAANTLSIFENLRNENRIIDTYDFVEDKDFVYNGSTHGTMVLSTMAGETNGSYVGTAPKATYALYRSEDDGPETPKEMLYWIQAAERADSIGADIINTSLGYSEFDDARYDYTYQDMDGKTTLIAQGAEVGVSRGILLVNAAGNEGDKSWKMITSPADAENVFTVGANDADKLPASFTSFGPNASGILKPNVSALGKSIAVASTSGNLVYSNGTSFASPVTTGAIALLIQQFPKISHKELKSRIEKTGHLYTSPTTQLGYGVPDFYKISLTILATNDEKFSSEVKIYPNPFKNSLTIECKNEIKSIELFNFTGQKVVESNNSKTLNTSKLSSGAYLLKIIDRSGKIFTEKVLKF